MRDVRITTLDNGMRVVTDPMSHVESVSLGVWVGVGTRHESAEINGVAHLLEHMAFKGTRRRNARAIAEEIEAVGGQLNAYTAREQTAYHAKMLAADMPLAIDILSDILQDSVFDETELARERTVILQEIGQANDTPDDVVFDHFQAVAFPDQPLGRPVLGEAEVIRGMPRDRIIGYMRENYRAGDMIVAAAGRVDHDALVALVAAKFDRLPTGRGASATAASYRGGEFRQARDLEQVHLVLGFHGVAIGDPDFYTQTVLSNLLGGGMSSRLFQQIREERGLVYSIYSFTSSYADNGLFGIYAGTGDAEVAELMPVLCEEILKLAGTVSDEEVERSRTQLKASLLMSLESSGARCEQIAQHMLVFGRVLSVDELVAKVEAVDTAAVRALATRLFTTPLTLAALGPVGHVAPFTSIVESLAG